MKKNNQPTEVKVLTAKEAADRAEVGTQTIINWIKDFNDEENGIIIGKKIGGRWKVYPTGLDKIISGELNYDNKRKEAGEEKIKKGNAGKCC